LTPNDVILIVVVNLFLGILVNVQLQEFGFQSFDIFKSILKKRRGKFKIMKIDICG